MWDCQCRRRSRARCSQTHLTSTYYSVSYSWSPLSYGLRCGHWHLNSAELMLALLQISPQEFFTMLHNSLWSADVSYTVSQQSLSINADEIPVKTGAPFLGPFVCSLPACWSKLFQISKFIMGWLCFIRRLQNQNGEMKINSLSGYHTKVSPQLLLLPFALFVWFNFILGNSHKTNFVTILKFIFGKRGPSKFWKVKESRYQGTSLDTEIWGYLDICGRKISGYLDIWIFGYLW